MEEYTIDAFFVAPHASIQACQVARPFICFDGGHMNESISGILLTASTLDPDKEILVLAFAIVPAESKEWWKYFFKFFFRCFYIEGNCTVISDRAKGLKATFEAKNPACVEYIRRIPRDQYAYCAAPLTEYPRFFHTTSNVSESGNSTFKPARGMP